MIQFMNVTIGDVGTLAEEEFHVQECDHEEYDRIFHFKSPLKMINAREDRLEWDSTLMKVSK